MLCLSRRLLCSASLPVFGGGAISNRRSTIDGSQQSSRAAVSTVLFKSLLGMRTVPSRYAPLAAAAGAVAVDAGGLSSSPLAEIPSQKSSASEEGGCEAVGSSINKSGSDNAPVRILVVTDKQPCTLGAAIRDAYADMLAMGGDSSSDCVRIEHKFIEFDPHTFRDDVGAYFGLNATTPASGPSDRVADATTAAAAASRDVVILIENGAFQNELQQYRLRLELFRHGIRVAEHCHLKTMSTTAATTSSTSTSSTSSGSSSSSEESNYFGACALDPFAAEAEGRLVRERLAGCTVPVPEALRLLGVEGGDAAEALLASSPSPSIGRKQAPQCVVLYDLVILSGSAADEHALVFSGGLETCLLNTGLYGGASAEAEREASLLLASAPAVAAPPPPRMTTTPTAQRSVGGTFPVGEVITESVDLGAVSGTAAVFAFPTVERRMCILSEPSSASASASQHSGGNDGDTAPSAGDGLLSVRIDNGCIVSLEGPPERRAEQGQLQAVLDLVTSAEGAVLVRELGIGLNPYLSRGAPLSDVTSFERQRGIHVSLGKRHPLFPKRARGDVTIEGLRGGTIGDATMGGCKADGSSLPLPLAGTSSSSSSSGTCAALQPAPQVGPVLRRKDGIFHIDMFIAATRVVLRPKAAFAHVLKEEVLMDFGR